MSNVAREFAPDDWYFGQACSSGRRPVASAVSSPGWPAWSRRTYVPGAAVFVNRRLKGAAGTKVHLTGTLWLLEMSSLMHHHERSSLLFFSYARTDSGELTGAALCGIREPRFIGTLCLRCKQATDESRTMSGHPERANGASSQGSTEC